MPPKQIKTVTVTYQDDTTETWELPPEQGFIREDYTYTPREGGGTLVRKWDKKLKTYRISWAEVA